MSTRAFSYSAATPSPPPVDMFGIGSDAPKALFCRTPLEAFNSYDPTLLRAWVVMPVVRLARRFMGEAMRLAAA